MKNFNVVTAGWNGLLQLFFPELCVACGRELPVAGLCFCTVCQLKLDPSDMYKQTENEFTARFWGRLALQTGAALYYFHRKSPIQRALHQLKYHNRPEIARQLGRHFGRKLADNPVFRTADVIVPIPLHPKKERKRGYNQSAVFARGLSETLGVPVLPHALRRREQGSSQTRKKRLERFDNVAELFERSRPGRLKNKHVLLVDDVLTTGATLETCGLEILKDEGCKLSVATIAIAMLS